TKIYTSAPWRLIPASIGSRLNFAHFTRLLRSKMKPPAPLGGRNFLEPDLYRVRNAFHLPNLFQDRRRDLMVDGEDHNRRSAHFFPAHLHVGNVDPGCAQDRSDLTDNPGFVLMWGDQKM